MSFFVLLLLLSLVAAAPSPLGCTVCQLVASIADHYLDSNATEAAVVQKLKQFCAQTQQALVCDAFVDYAVPILAADAANATEPATLCDDFGLCMQRK